VPAPSPSYQRHKNKHISTADGLVAIAKSMDSTLKLLAGAVEHSAPPASPTKHRAAITAIKGNKNLEPSHFTAAVNLIMNHPPVATSYLTIHNPAA
jgi:hypothetical protein